MKIIRRLIFITIMTLGLQPRSCFASILDNADVKRTLDSGISIWKMTLLGPQGETPEFSADYARFQGCTLSHDGSSAVLKWFITLDRVEDNSVEVTVSESDGLSLWEISAHLPAGWIVSEVTFPIIRVKRDEGSKAILPMGYGAEFNIPLNGSSLLTRYPSVTGGMEFVLTHSPAGSYYFAAQDKEGCAKYFYIQGTASTLTFSQKAVTSYAWSTESGDFSMPWTTAFAFNPQEWDKTLLKWYRPFVLTAQWAEKPLECRDITPWVRNADVWMRPKNMYPEVTDALRKAVKYYDRGLGVHWYHWHNYAYDTMYPEYLPAKSGFPQMVKEIQRAGAHVTPYINGRLWDPSNDSYKKKGHLASCRKADGTLYTEIYPTSNVPNTVTCPSTEIWQEVIKELADSIVLGIGTDGLYIDQVSAAASEPCYAANHPHAPGAGDWWPKAYRSLFGELHSRVFHDGKAVTSEENAEVYMDLLDMMLIVNTPHSADVKMVPVFPLIYSDRAVYSGLNYYHQGLNDGHFLYNNARSLLWGAQLGWIQPEWLFADGNDVEIEFLRTLGRFRARNHDVFFGGRFIEELVFDEPLPTITVFDGEVYPVVMGAHWINTNGKDAYIVVNMSGEDRMVTLPTGEKVKVKAYNVKRR